MGDCCCCDPFAGGSGATTFLGLTDTPASYAGQALLGVRVNAAETGLEFFAVGGGTISTITESTDEVIAITNPNGPITDLATPNIAFSTADGSMSIGGGSVTPIGETDCVMVGFNANAQGFSCTAVGRSADAQGTDASALGRSASAIGNWRSAFGASALSSGDEGTAVGASAEADTQGSSLGAFCQADGVASCAMGYQAVATGASSVSLGANSRAPAANGVSIGPSAGNNVGITGADLIAIGSQSANAAITGASNMCIGVQAGNTIGAGSTNICIGNQAGAGGTSIGAGTGNVIIGSSKNIPTAGSNDSTVLGDALEHDNTFAAGFLNGSMAFNGTLPTDAKYGFENNAAGPTADTSAILRIESTGGANGAAYREFVGTRDPNGVVTGNPGDRYQRVSGASSGLYINTGAAVGNTTWTLLGAGGGGANSIFMWASLQGQANSTQGMLQIFHATTGNPGGVIEQTDAGTGIQNGDVAPLYLPACTLVKAGLTFAGAAVAQGTTGGAMTARFGLYDSAYSSRALITNLDFPVSSAGVFNNVSGNNFERGITLAPSVAIAEGTLAGLEFTNRSANNNEINGMRGMYVYLEFEL